MKKVKDMAREMMNEARARWESRMMPQVDPDTGLPTGSGAQVYVPPPSYRVGDEVLLEGKILDARDLGNLVVQVGPVTFTISIADLDHADLVRHPPAEV